MFIWCDRGEYEQAGEVCGVRQYAIRHVLEYIGVVEFVRTARNLPAGISVRLGSLLGGLAFDWIGFRRSVSLSNLERHLPGVTSEGERRRVGRQSYMSFGMGMAEFARLPLVDAEYVAGNITTEGLEHLDLALRRGKGAVLVTGHFGSWELMGCVLVHLGYPVDFVVGIQKNPLVQGLMNDLRKGAGIDVIDLRSTLAIMRSLRRNRFVAMLSDQDAGSRGVFVDFLGEQASTPAGAARLAIMADAPVISGFIIRTGRTRHRIVIEPPIYPQTDSDRSAEVMRITKAYTERIEAYVKAYPDHWLWGHRRWKTRPA
jgi:KDO2-lipid IV(A) lauroyltransferase